MSSLYNRATGPQRWMLGIVSGAVLNAAHAHPGHAINERFARSVSKRAVGTISASWPELLAANTPSGAERSSRSPLRNGSDHVKAHGGRRHSGLAGPRFHKAIVSEIARLIGPARKAGETARVEALVEVMRIIDKVTKASVPVRFQDKEREDA